MIVFAKYKMAPLKAFYDFQLDFPAAHQQQLALSIYLFLSFSVFFTSFLHLTKMRFMFMIHNGNHFFDYLACQAQRCVLKCMRSSNTMQIQLMCAIHLFSH